MIGAVCVKIILVSDIMDDVCNVAKILEMQYRHDKFYEGAVLSYIVLDIFTLDEYMEMWHWWMSIEWM